MKNWKSLLIGLVLALFSIPGVAQTAITTTTLAAAVTSSSTTTIKVASATGIVAGSTILYIEDGTGGPNVGEAVFVNSVNGTTLGVTRGYNSTIGNPHINGALVYVGPANPNSPFVAVDPTGACTPANTLFTPLINIRTGNQWLCSSVTNSWVPGFFNNAAPAGVTAAVASVAGATLPSGPLFHVTGTNTITAWGSSTTVGMGTGGGSKTDVIGAPFCIIPDGLGATAAGNNIAIASTFVVNKILCFTFDQTNKKYVPSY